MKLPEINTAHILSSFEDCLQDEGKEMDRTCSEGVEGRDLNSIALSERGDDASCRRVVFVGNRKKLSFKFLNKARFVQKFECTV